MNEVLAVAAQYGGLSGLVLAIVTLGIGLARIVPPLKLADNEAARDRAAARAGDWDRLREEVTRHADEARITKAEFVAEIRELKAENVECHKNLADAIRRIAALEGYDDGQGKARQEAQVIVSTERKIDDVARKAPRKPGLRRDKP